MRLETQYEGEGEREEEEKEEEKKKAGSGDFGDLIPKSGLLVDGTW